MYRILKLLTQVALGLGLLSMWLIYFYLLMSAVDWFKIWIGL